MSNRRVHHLLVDTYKTEDAVSAARAVIAGATEGNCKLPAGANANNVLGVTKYDCADDSDAEIVTMGDVELTVNAASVNIAVGDAIKTSTTTGICVKAATDKDHAFAYALEAATADAVVISVRLGKFDVAV